MHTRSRASLAITLFVAVFSNLAIAADGDDELEAIFAAQAAIQSLQSVFVQTKQLSLFDETIVARGTIIIDKPDFYCWIYEEPERSVFYVDGMRTGSYQPGSGEREEVGMESRIGLAAIIRSVTAIVSGNLGEATRSEYEISRNAPATGLLSYTFHPRTQELQSLFEQVTIRFDPRTRLARDLLIEEQNGDSTQIEFESWQINIPVDRAGLLEQPKQEGSY
jgi:outer membrane lipoprotein-sorting protein